MKDGKLVEQGTHDDLMKKDGEYRKLHNIQAQAFTPVRILYTSVSVNSYLCFKGPVSHILSASIKLLLVQIETHVTLQLLEFERIDGQMMMKVTIFYLTSTNKSYKTQVV